MIWKIEVYSDNILGLDIWFVVVVAVLAVVFGVLLQWRHLTSYEPCNQKLVDGGTPHDRVQSENKEFREVRKNKEKLAGLRDKYHVLVLSTTLRKVIHLLLCGTRYIS